MDIEELIKLEKKPYDILSPEIWGNFSLKELIHYYCRSKEWYYDNMDVEYSPKLMKLHDYISEHKPVNIGE